MSYAERRRRKNLKPQGPPTPRQRRLHPELYGVRGQLDQFTHAVTYEYQSDGGRKVIFDHDLRRTS